MLKILGVLLLMAVSAQAQFTITGTIHEAKDNRILPGATIQLDETTTGAVSDEYGRFQLRGVEAGGHVLKVRFLGYSDKDISLEIHADQFVDISLEEQATMTDEVVVSATRANERTPTTYTNVSRQAIQKQNFGQDLPIILNWTPVVVTTSDAGAGVGYTGIRVRGSDATRVNVTINGIPYNDSESQGAFWVDIPDIASSTQSIQIQRGVGTSSNGAGAFGASLNLQTNSLQAEPYAEFVGAAGSFNTRRITVRAGTGLMGRWAFDGKISNITSDGYVERASSDLGSYYFSGGYYGRNTIIKAIAFGGREKTYQSWYGVDRETMNINRRMNYAGALYDANGDISGYYDNQVDDYRQDHYQLHVSQQLGDAWNANLSGHYTYGRGFYEEYHQSAVFADMGLPDIVLADTTLTSSDVIVRKWLDNKFYGFTYSLNYTGVKTSAVIGGAYNEYGDAKHFGELTWAQYAPVPIRYQYYQGKSQKNDFNTYAKWTFNLTDKVSTFVDLQYRHVSYRTAGIRDDQSPYDVNEGFDFFNPKVGVSLTFSDKSMLYASWAIANREPNRSDYVDSDTKPRPEHLANIEVGLRKATARHAFEVNYYLMNYSDQLVLTGELDNVGYPIRANVGKSYRMGVEASALLRPSNAWTWNVNTTVSQNRNRDYVVIENNIAVTKNTAIILSPAVIGGSQLSWSGIDRLQISWLSKYVGKQYLDNNEDESVTLPAYFINDLRFNYTITPSGMRELGFSLLFNNIFDVAYSSNGYSYAGTPYYYPQAGRNFMAMVTMKF